MVGISHRESTAQSVAGKKQSPHLPTKRSLVFGLKERRQVEKGKLQLVFVSNCLIGSKTNGGFIGDYRFSVNN
jgi:hypothetical protein